MKAIAHTLRITPKKLNLIAHLVRNKSANEALDILRFTPKKGAKLLHKVLKSAVANAENNFKQSAKTLYIKEIVVTKAMTIKRGISISRGRVHPILKRNAHVSVTVGVNTESSKAEKVRKSPKGTKSKSEITETKTEKKKSKRNSIKSST